MDTSGGKQSERLMTLVPLTVFAFVVIVWLGGTGEFVNTVGGWVGDVMSMVTHWLRNL